MDNETNEGGLEALAGEGGLEALAGALEGGLEALAGGGGTELKLQCPTHRLKPLVHLYFNSFATSTP